MNKQITRRQFMYGFGVGIASLFARPRFITDWSSPDLFSNENASSILIASLTDYKFSYISRQDDGTMHVKMRFYEGEKVEESEEIEPGEFELITRYRRSGIVQRPTDHFSSLSGASIDYEEKERLGDELGDAVIVTLPRQLTEVELIRAMNVVLAEDTTRTPIDERQVIT